MHIYYEVTNKCNLNCDYCYSQSNTYEYGDLDFVQFVTIIDDMMKSMSLSSITFSGGEPLLHNEIIDMLEYCIDNNLKVYLITNGLLIDDFKFGVLSKMNNIIVSLHDNYENNINYNIIKQLFLKTRINFNVVLNQNNVFKMDEYYDFSKKMRIPITFRIQKAKGRGVNSSLLDKEEILKANSRINEFNKKSLFKIPSIINNDFTLCCYFSKEFDEYTMLPNGDINLCSVLSHSYRVGSALDTQWKDNVLFTKNKLYDDWKLYENNVCGKCFLQGKCKGICPGEIESINDKCMQCHLRCDKVLMDLL